MQGGMIEGEVSRGEKETWLFDTSFVGCGLRAKGRNATKKAREKERRKKAREFRNLSLRVENGQKEKKRTHTPTVAKQS